MVIAGAHKICRRLYTYRVPCSSAHGTGCIYFGTCTDQPDALLATAADGQRIKYFVLWFGDARYGPRIRENCTVEKPLGEPGHTKGPMDVESTIGLHTCNVILVTKSDESCHLALISWKMLTVLLAVAGGLLGSASSPPLNN